jgi:hypothetical protein
MLPDPKSAGLPGDEPATRRAAASQPTLRRVNEAIRGGDRLALRCECGRLGCNTLIELTRAEFQAIRAHSGRFAVVPGHGIPELEATVEHHERYAVVETHGGGPPAAP